MAFTSRPVSEYIVKQARIKFLEMVKIIEDPALYKFGSMTLDDGTIINVVNVGLHEHKTNAKNQKPLWANMDGSRFIYFQQDSQKVTLEKGAGDLYPDQGKTLHRSDKEPFSLVAPRHWPRNSHKKELAREEARKTLKLLIKFAFILTGRAKDPAVGDTSALLMELESLCKSLQEIQLQQREALTKRARVEDDEEEEEGESRSARPLQTQLSRARGQTPVKPYHKRAKRDAEEMVGTSADHGVQDTRDHREGLNPVPSLSGDHGDTGSSAPRPVSASQHLQYGYKCFGELIQTQVTEEAALKDRVDTLEAQVEKFRAQAKVRQDEDKALKAQLEKSHAQAKVRQDENTALKAQIRMLQDQIAEHAGEYDEWQEQHRLLAELVQRSVGARPKARLTVRRS